MAKEIDGKIPQLGFVGIGPMGGKMARWLLEAGYPLMVYDIDRQKCEDIKKEGATVALSNTDLVNSCDIVLTSLPLSEVLVSVSEKEFIPNAKPGQIFIDMGTVTPVEARRLEAAYKEKGAFFIDSPVSNGNGGPGKRLLIFAGGDQKAVEKIWPLYEVMGVPEHTVYCGPSGSGQIVKGVNQLNIGLVQAAMLETIAFGVRAGVSPDIILKAIGEENNPGARGGGIFYGICKKAVEGSANQVVVKHGQLKHYIKESEIKGFELPITKALYEFLKDSPETIQDANRRSPSCWDELMTRAYKDDINS